MNESTPHNQAEEFDFEALYASMDDTLDISGPEKMSTGPSVHFDSLNMMKDRLNTLLEKKEKRSPITSADVMFANDSMHLDRCLLDTGASGRNYISEKVVTRLLKHFSSELNLEDCNAGVILGDNKTHVVIDRKITLTIVMPDSRRGQVATIECLVFTTDYDLVIGVNDIIDHFLPVLWKALGGSTQTEYGSLSTLIDENETRELSEPFDFALETSPEELATPEPCSFSYALDYLGRDLGEVWTEYREILPSLIDPEHRNNLRLHNMLRSSNAYETFCPRNWEGINGVEPLELKFADDMPPLIKPAARHVNPRLQQPAKAEFNKLNVHFYRPSKSRVASCLVIAPKKTKPFIRFCGDYVKINQWIPKHFGYIPRVPEELTKIKGFSIFIDLDMSEAFHQIKIGPKTSEMLSVVTPWGQVEPMFLPEGVPPASIELQDIVRSIFSDHSDYLIFVFDNLLILGTSPDDVLDKFEKVLETCVKRNVHLKVSKSKFLAKEVNFFGYICSKNGWKLAEDKFEAIKNFKLPEAIKPMRSFLGTCVFFQRFVPNFAEAARPFYDSLKKDFKWPLEPKHDWESKFDCLKTKLLNAFGLFFPDYNLEFLLRTDASHYAFGAVLLQIDIVDGIKLYQPIAFGSYKFSEQALKWDTHKKELYAIFYFVVIKWKFYLAGKSFIIETDHANLRYLESSENAMVIRWKIALQNFSFLLRYIPGRDNEVADSLSRDVALFNCLYSLESLDSEYSEDSEENITNLVSHFNYEHLLIANDASDIPHLIEDDSDDEEQVTTPVDPFPNSTLICSDKISEFFKSLHNGRVGHWGPTRMFQNANRQMPGHGIPIRYFKEFVSTCPYCQKERIDLNDRLIGIMKNKKVPNAYSAVGIDNVTITPRDMNGNVGICVVMNLYTHYVKLYPYPSISAKHTTDSLIDFFSTIGVCDTIYSDLGSDYTSKMLEDLSKWLGTTHLFALVGRHQSNGVERQIKEVTRHLRYLVNEEEIKDRWSEPSVLCCIEYIINSAPHSENGSPAANLSPYALTFGTLYLDKFRFSYKSDISFKSFHIQELNDNFKTLHEAASKYQKELTLSRKKNHSVSSHLRVGDLVLRYVKKPFRDAKLSCLNKGPYSVTAIKENSIDIQHLAFGNIISVHIEELSIFIGTKAEAEELATLDADHFFILAIIEYLGNVSDSNTLVFKVLYKDNEVAYLPYENGICHTSAFDSLAARHNNELILFKEMLAKERTDTIDQINKDPTILHLIGEEGFTKLRFFNMEWVESLSLFNEPREDDLVKTSTNELVSQTKKEHLIRYKIMSIKRRKDYLVYQISLPLFDGYSFTGDNYWLFAFALNFDSDYHLLIDEDTIEKFPTIRMAFMGKFSPEREVV